MSNERILKGATLAHSPSGAWDTNLFQATSTWKNEICQPTRIEILSGIHTTLSLIHKKQRSKNLLQNKSYFIDGYMIQRNTSSWQRVSSLSFLIDQEPAGSSIQLQPTTCVSTMNLKCMSYSHLQKNVSESMTGIQKKKHNNNNNRQRRKKMQVL